MKEQKQPIARVKLVADIPVATQALLVKLIKKDNGSKIGLITRLIHDEAARRGIE